MQSTYDKSLTALLVVDPASWLSLDTASLPGLTFAHQGLARVRWGADRVCLLALDAVALDAQRRGEPSRSWSLVALWAGEHERGAALRAPDLRQELSCRMEADEAAAFDASADVACEA